TTLFRSERHAIHVAEQHRAAQPQLGDSALQLGGRCRGVIERQRGERRESLAAGSRHGGQGVVHQPRQGDGARQRLDVRAGRREGQHLPVHALAREHLLAIGDVAVAAHRDVVIARIADDRIAVGVGRQLYRRGSAAQCFEILGWVVVVVEVDDHEGERGVGGKEGRRTQRAYTGSPVRTRASPNALVRGFAATWLAATSTAAAANRRGTAGTPQGRYAGAEAARRRNRTRAIATAEEKNHPVYTN